MDRLLSAIRWMIGLPLRPMLTRGTCGSVVIVDRCKWLSHLAQNGKAEGLAGSFLPLALSLNRSALSRQLRVARTSLLLELGNSHAAFPTLWGAKMPARGREGGGSVVAKRLAVMARTW